MLRDRVRIESPGRDHLAGVVAEVVGRPVSLSLGIGTARAFVVDEVAGTFAGIAMGLNAVLTALIVPIILAWFL